MKCPNCLQEVPDKAGFCPFCGSKTIINEQNPNNFSSSDLPETDKISRESDWQYTGRINSRRGDIGQQENNDIYIIPPVKEKPKKGSGKLPILIIAASCIIIALSLIFLFQKGVIVIDHKDKQSSSEEEFSSSKTTVSEETTSKPEEGAIDRSSQNLSEENTMTPIPTETPTPIPTETPTPIPTEIPTPIPTETPTPVPAVAVSNVITIYGGIQANASDFLFPESSTEYLTTERMNQVMESSDSDMMHKLSQLAINELLARYGFTFTKDSQTAQDARDQFEGKAWYESAQEICPSNDYEVLLANYMNSYEVTNFRALNQWQKDHGVWY